MYPSSVFKEENLKILNICRTNSLVADDDRFSNRKKNDHVHYAVLCTKN